MIEPKHSYSLSDTLRELIMDNRQLLMVISRFGISLHHVGCRVSELAECASVHPETFLCVANMISGRPYDATVVDLCSLIDYLKRAHSYFLDFFLPEIRRKLLDAIDFGREPELAPAVMRFFDDYVGEVRRHMNYENDNLFVYVDGLLAGMRDSNFTVGMFAEHHDAVSHKLRRLKDVLIRYAPERNVDKLNSALFDIINCEDDLESHCRVEDEILVPAVRAAEEKISVVKVTGRKPEAVADSGADSALGKREREIIAYVAKGMSNKEIADRLFISVHTVATHRRNICSKLGIHSPAGLTVYAILNGMVDLNDIDL
ncbi:MAG: helix-turn-helix transcriptional regulator [Muribaculaceae bacterium]|nr:helix-turn-helix transcriptional regulator [Muribaculaceae bacterium]